MKQTIHFKPIYLNATARDSISLHYITLHYIPSIKFTGNSVIIVP